MSPYVIPGLKRHINIDYKDIPSVVAIYYGLNREILSAKCRKRKHVLARHVAMYLLNETALLKHPKIGEMFNRDRTTVMNGVQMIRNYISTRDQNVIRDLEKIKNMMIK